MNDAETVQVRERSSYLPPDGDNLGRVESVAFGEKVLEALSLDQFHAQKDVTAGFVEVVDGDDVGMAVARGTDLPPQPFAGAFIVEVRVEDLDGDLLADRSVKGREDRPGRAVAEDLAEQESARQCVAGRDA